MPSGGRQGAQRPSKASSGSGAGSSSGNGEKAENPSSRYHPYPPRRTPAAGQRSGGDRRRAINRTTNNSLAEDGIDDEEKVLEIYGGIVSDRKARRNNGGYKEIPESDVDDMIEGEKAEDDEEEVAEDEDEDDGVVRCLCKNKEDYELMIQCEKCQVWQHTYCMGIKTEDMVPDEYYCEECQPEDHPYIDSKPRSQVVSKQQQQQRAGAKKGTSNNSGNNGSRRRNSSSIDDDESEKTPPMPTVKEERAQSKKSRRLTTQETIELDSANEGDGGDEPVVEDIVAVMLGATPKRPYASRVLSNRRDVPSADKPNAANETELSDGTKNPTVDFEHSNSMGLIMSPTKRRKTGRNGGGSSGGSNSGSSTPRSKGRGGRNGRRGPDQAGSHTEASSKDNNLKPADRDSEDDCGGEGDTLEDARSEANTVLSAELISPTFLTNSLSDQRQAEGNAGGDSRTLKGNTGGARRSGTKGHASAQGTPVGRDSQSRASHSRPPSVMTHASFDLAAAEWPADQNLDRVQQLTSTNREGLPLYTSNEPSACRIRYPSPNATLADFTHRAKEMLEWVGKVQSEYLEEQSRWREALAIYRERRGMPHPADMSFSRESTARATPDVHAPMTVLSPHDGQRLQQQEEPSVTEESPSSMSYHKLPPPPSEASTDPVDPSEWPENIGEFEERSLPKRSVSQPASPTHRPLMGAIQEVKTRTKRAHTIILSPAEAQVPQLNAPPIVPQPQHTDIAYQRGSKNEPLNVTEQQEPKGDDEELASGGNRREDASDEEDNSTLYMLESLVCRLIKFQETYAT